MAILNILENPLDRPVDEQLKQLNLNVQAELLWSKTVKDGLVLNFTDETGTLSTSSTDYSQIPAFISKFTPTSNLLYYVVKLNLQATVNSSIALVIDNNIIDEYNTGVNASHTLIMNGIIPIAGGVNHNIFLQWKVLTAGTLTKFNLAKNKMQLVSLIA